jgi:hypothetical protein
MALPKQALLSPEHKPRVGKSARRTATPHQYGVDIWSRSNPRSVINIVSAAVRDSMLQLTAEFKDIIEMPEYEVARRCHKHIEARDYRIRILFWDEYNCAQDDNRHMINERIFAGASSAGYFWLKLLKNPYKLVWMLTPPAAYEITQRELLQLGLTRMREVLSLPIVDKKGAPNTSLIKQMVSIFALIDNRVQGGVKQTLDINQKSLHVNMDHVSAMAAVKEGKDVRELDREIDRLKIELEAQSMSKRLQDGQEIEAAFLKEAVPSGQDSD